MFDARPRARPRVRGVQAVTCQGSEQGPPGGPYAALQRVVGLGVFLVRASACQRNPLGFTREGFPFLGGRRRREVSAMQVVRCKVGETIALTLPDGREVEIRIRRGRGNAIRLSIESPPGVHVDPGEVARRRRPRKVRPHRNGRTRPLPSGVTPAELVLGYSSIDVTRKHYEGRPADE